MHKLLHSIYEMLLYTYHTLVQYIIGIYMHGRNRRIPQSKSSLKTPIHGVADLESASYQHPYSESATQKVLETVLINP